ncbi:RNA-binding protein [Trypanosoma rangeli]|uniref:RNA-binding protein n=1 Tax=Trypanosoma rangeli TaxID=5698 RepID=A0A3R7MYC3_TRYRA|nr:RNA-binding protein [Trypanosoma rangeli]RNE97175.1 RNA-binding protein [Trypanosoma rangeli]|eukprot:RNE97175.1 RNA-binding protein [Trypanosoma rangeli]
MAASGADPRNLIVNYIPTPVSDDVLRHLFERFGPLLSARVIRDRKKGEHPKGYGFVVYADKESGLAAMEAMNGFEIHNKRLRVSLAFGPGNAQPKRKPSPRATVQDRKASSHVASLPSAGPCAPRPYPACSAGLDPRRDPNAMAFQGMPTFSFPQTFCASPLAMAPQKLTIMNAVPVEFYAAPHFILAPAEDGTQLLATPVHPQGLNSPAYTPPPPPPPSVIVVPNTGVNNNVIHASLNGTTIASKSSAGLVHNGDSDIRQVPPQAAPTIRVPKESACPALLQPLFFPPSVSLLPQLDPAMAGGSPTCYSSLGSLDVASVTASSKPSEAINGFMLRSP